MSDGRAELPDNLGAQRGRRTGARVRGLVRLNRPDANGFGLLRRKNYPKPEKWLDKCPAISFIQAWGGPCSAVSPNPAKGVILSDDAAHTGRYCHSEGVRSDGRLKNPVANEGPFAEFILSKEVDSSLRSPIRPDRTPADEGPALTCTAPYSPFYCH
jgi:hypothetical protein